MSRRRFDLLPPGLNNHRPHRQSSIHVQDWRDQAACAGTDPDVFHPPDGAAGREIAKQARALCTACPVRVDCLATAIAEAEDRGIWGGCTERERRVIARAAAIHQTAGPDETDLIRRRLTALLDPDHNHGTLAMWAYGCRCPACRFAGGSAKTDRTYTQETA